MSNFPYMHDPMWIWGERPCAQGHVFAWAESTTSGAVPNGLHCQCGAMEWRDGAAHFVPGHFVVGPGEWTSNPLYYVIKI